MKFELKFKENNQNLDMNFGRFQNVTDGGFERGYEQGLVDGKQVGFDSAISKLTEIEITENGRYTPVNENIGFSLVDVNVEGTEAIEQLIDESGVLDSTEGTATEKVEQLIDKADELDVFMHITSAYQLFYQAKSFPSKAVVNLPNATNNLYQAFSYWNTEPIPIVEELTVNAPKVTELSSTFHSNNGVKKVILNVSDETQRIELLFAYCKSLEEVVLNFSTKKVAYFSGVFGESTVKRIIGVLDFSSATIITGFGTCNDLEEITVEPNTIYVNFSLQRNSKLSANSVRSIIDGLATVTTARTLTLNKAIVLTDEQKATIQAKGWTLAQ